MKASLSERIHSDLHDIVDGDLFIDPDILHRYSQTQGWYQIAPLAVLHPRTIQDIQSAVRVCQTLNVPVIARGAGTGLSGHGIGFGLIIDLSVHFTKILNRTETTVTVQPGVVLADLIAHLAPHNAWFPVDPTSAPHCTIGGMIATNAAGWHGPAYGSTKDHVSRLSIVCADGSLKTFGPPAHQPDGKDASGFHQSIEKLLRPHEEHIIDAFPNVSKNSSGYNLKDAVTSRPIDIRKLLIGSEGTLGIVVEADIAVTPLPAATGGLLISGTRYEDIVTVLERLGQTSYAAAEFMDPTFIVHGNFPPQWAANDKTILLYLDFHYSSAAELTSSIASAEKIALAVPGIACTTITRQKDRELLFRCRQEASEHINMDKDRWKASFIEDGTVPLKELTSYISFLKKLLDEKHIPFALYGHAADGNLHCSPFIDHRNLDHYKMIDEIAFTVADTIASLGGTLSGEHGDGFVRTPFLKRIYGEKVFTLFQGVKDVFDPSGIFHPGIITGPQNVSIAHDLSFT
jgi:FAD/FMN-containing dehydrogenase